MPVMYCVILFYLSDPPVPLLDAQQNQTLDRSDSEQNSASLDVLDRDPPGNVLDTGMETVDEMLRKLRSLMSMPSRWG